MSRQCQRARVYREKALQAFSSPGTLRRALKAEAPYYASRLRGAHAEVHADNGYGGCRQESAIGEVCNRCSWLHADRSAPTDETGATHLFAEEVRPEEQTINATAASAAPAVAKAMG